MMKYFISPFRPVSEIKTSSIVTNKLCVVSRAFLKSSKKIDSYALFYVSGFLIIKLFSGSFSLICFSNVHVLSRLRVGYPSSVQVQRRNQLILSDIGNSFPYDVGVNIDAFIGVLFKRYQ